MLLKRCVVPRTLLTQRFLSTSNKSFSEGKSDETSFERRDKLRSDDKSSSECKGSFGAEKSFAKASTKSQAKKTEDINRASDTGFDTKRESDELNSEKLMGDNRSSQQTKRNPLQTQRNFSTMGMLPKSKQVMSSSVRYLSEDLNPGMDKKNKFEKKDEECSSCDDNKSQDKQKKGEFSTKSKLSGNSQEKWRGSANEDNSSQDNQRAGTGSQQTKRNPLQTQRNFSTVGMMPNSKLVMGSSVRYLSEDLNPGMDKKNKFEKKDEECNSCDDNKSQDKQKKGEISTRSLSSDSTGKSQEKWRGSANEDNKSQEMNKDKTMSNRSCGTGFSEADKRSEAKDKAQNKEWRTS
jgi:hypothetical protein